MNKLILVGFLLAVLIVIGCENVDLSKVSQEDIDKVIVCDKPYIRHASGCCLDQNDNTICDNDEKTFIIEEERIMLEVCTISSWSGLFCDAFSVSSDEISIRIKNSLGESITITSFTVTNSKCNPLSTSVTIPADERATITLRGCSITDKIVGDMLLRFEDSDGFIKSTSGRLSAKVS